MCALVTGVQTCALPIFPFIGPELSIWIRGDYVVSDATLNRFFAFHVIAIPLVLIGLVAAHIVALHEVGSNNPDGIERSDERSVGKESVSTGISRWSPYPSKNKTTQKKRLTEYID